MSWTGLDLRHRARRHAARFLDHLADRIDPRDPADRAPAPAPEPMPAPAPTPAAAASATPPLPDLPKPPTPATKRAEAEAKAAAPPSPTARATPAAQRAAEAPEDRQAKHWARTRSGMLRFVDEQGGAASLREMHDHSERTWFVAHVQFSKLMEELTDEGLLDYDEDTATASLTDAGRAEL